MSWHLRNWTWLYEDIVDDINALHCLDKEDHRHRQQFHDDQQAIIRQIAYAAYVSEFETAEAKLREAESDADAKRSTIIMDLPDQCLNEMFSYMSSDDLLALESVNIRFKTLAEEVWRLRTIKHADLIDL